MIREKLILVASVAMLVVLLIIYLRLAAFPGRTVATTFTPETTGVKSTFRNGVVYRYPGMVPMLEVAGNHYEMGLQYGVLLKPEIMQALVSYKKILKWQAQKMRVPYALMVPVAKLKAKQIAKRIPGRFLEEIRGISDGSGVPFDTVLTIALFYDIDRSMACTGLLMKGEGSTIIHGHNQDATFFGGEEVAKVAVVVKYKADNYHTVTQEDFLFFLGIETGYNDAGLAVSEETLPIKKTNPKGGSYGYFTRMALEECANLAEVKTLLGKHQFIGGYGMIWSDRNSGQGFLAEIAGKNQAITDMHQSLLWDFNRIYNPDLQQFQAVRTSMSGDNLHREAIASIFPEKPIYELQDAMDFLAAHQGPNGVDYAWSGSKTSVCNRYTQQMVIFDAKKDGFYFALGTYFGSLSRVYHVFDDFSRQPEVVREALALDPRVEDEAIIENRLITGKEKLVQFLDLAKKYPSDAKAQFLVAYQSFHLREMEHFAEYAKRAFAFEPNLPEYKLFAGMAAYQAKEYAKAARLLIEIDSAELIPEQEVYRLSVLERIFKKENSPTASKYTKEKERMIAQYSAQDYHKKIARKIRALER